MGAVMWVVAAIILLIAFANVSRVEHVNFGDVGLVYSKGRYANTLDPGRYRLVDPFKLKKIERISVLPAAMAAHQYDVISRDQFAFRVTVTPLFTITEPRVFHENTPAFVDHGMAYSFGPEARLTRVAPVLAEAVLAQVATKTLEEFMADPVGALASVGNDLAEVMPGAELDRIAVTAINLPPEVRKMFTEVERARREGLAGLERAKAEQASLRALANAARNMAGNPQLAQLRMLQTMESAKGAKTFVLGSPADLTETGHEPKD